MTGIETSIVSMYEEHNLTPEDIGRELDCSDASVKSVLAQWSSKYKEILRSQQKNALQGEGVDALIEEYEMLRHEAVDKPEVKEKILRNLINLKAKVTDGLGRDNQRELIKLKAKEEKDDTTRGAISALNDFLRRQNVLTQGNRVIDVDPQPRPRLIEEGEQKAV